MFLVSWNVAAWSTTTAAIRGSFGSLETFLNILDADILCLQETKIAKKKLESDEVACGAADRPGFPIAGYESFWCYCTDKGMNGVCTFAKTGLTHRVDPKPLGDESLDVEGRCIATYHSHFTLFNVYVPNSRGGERQMFKQQFLAALKAAMDRARLEAGKPVVLVGDMNFSYRAQDCHYSNRKLCLQSLSVALAHAALTADSDVLPSHPPGGRLFSQRYPLCAYEEDMLLQLVGLIQEHVVQKLGKDALIALDSAAMVGAKQHMGRSQQFIAATERVDKLRCLLRNAHDDGVIQQVTVSAADRSVTGDGGKDEDRSGVAADGISTFRDYVWVDALVRGSANSINDRHEALYVASECIGLPCHARADSEFAISLLTDATHPMVDTFVMFTERSAVPDSTLGSLPPGEASLLTPGCPRRPALSSVYPQPYTCWDQYRNKRYENEGNRIDYIFADASLLQQFTSPNALLQLQNSDGVRDTAPQSLTSKEHVLAGYNGDERKIGLTRATAGGRYSAAPTSGGGMEKLRDVDKMLMFGDTLSLPIRHGHDLLATPTQAPLSHRRSGLLVTPPQFSDHIGVTLVLLPQNTSDMSVSTVAPLLRRASGTTVVDPSGVLHRRKSANLMNMFAKVAAKKSAPAALPSIDKITSNQKRQRDEEPTLDNVAPTPSAASHQPVDIICIDDD